MIKNFTFFCLLFACAVSLWADEYSDLMYKAEKLTEKRFDKGSRAYKIKSAELDSILNSQEDTSKKIEKLKAFIADQEKSSVNPKQTVTSVKDGKAEYEQAMKYMNSDPQKAEELLQASLSHGYYKSAEELGKFYSLKGEAFRGKAEEYYEIALKHKLLSARLPLAELYMQHYESLPKQKQRDAIKWLEESASSNNISAMLILADFYKDSNQKKMLKYLRAAAKLKEPKAMYLLGMFYFENPRQRSYEKAFHYFEAAEESNHIPSRLMLAIMYLKGQGSIQNTKQAYKLFMTLYEKDGMLAAGIPLGYLYFHGEGTKKNYAKAVRYIQTGLTVKQRIPGNFAPYSMLGIMYYEGQYGVTQDMAQARTYLEKAYLEQEENPEALYILGCMYRDQQGGFLKDDKKAVEYFERAKTIGDMKAQTDLGWMYYYGKGVKQDYDIAVSYLSYSADNDDLRACKAVADVIFDKKTSKDDSIAAKYYGKLASKNDSHGLCRYGLMLYQGRGTIKNTKYGLKNLKAAASLGNVEAMYICGNIEKQNRNLTLSAEYFRTAAEKNDKKSMWEFVKMTLLENNDVKADPLLGLKYLRILADSGDISAQEKYGLLMEKGKAPAIKPDINEAVRYYEMAYKQKSELAGIRLAYIAFQRKQYDRAFQLSQDAADRKNILAASLMGRLYFEGKGTSSNPEKALYYFRIAADGGNVYAIEVIGPMYYYRKMYKDALYFLEKSSIRDTPQIRFMIGNIYYTGFENRKPDYAKAMEYLHLAADNGSIDAMLLLAKMYQQGDGVEQDYAKAFSWYRLAAQRESPEAFFQIGRMYYNGNGVTPNYTTALQWFKKAADKGNQRAIQYIIIMYREGQGVEKNKKEVQKWQEKLQKLRT